MAGKVQNISDNLNDSNKPFRELATISQENVAIDSYGATPDEFLMDCMAATSWVSCIYLCKHRISE